MTDDLDPIRDFLAARASDLPSLAEAAPGGYLTPGRLRAVFPAELGRVSDRRLRKALASAGLGLVQRLAFWPRGYRDPLAEAPRPAYLPSGRRRRTTESRVAELLARLHTHPPGAAGVSRTALRRALQWEPAALDRALDRAHRDGALTLAWIVPSPGACYARVWLPPHAPPAGWAPAPTRPEVPA